jgi:NAD(P)-dependent dehydrogenase (short-subunit alcohol dehydrogenase family)
MDIRESIAFVTGANRGIGKAYVEALAQAGARRIYATARDTGSLKDLVAFAPDRIIPLPLDLTDANLIANAARTAQDVTILINNAGVSGRGGLFTAESTAVAQWEMNTNYFGTLNIIRAFAPILKHNGGGTIVNLLSIVSVGNAPVFGSYSASKAALFSLTQGVRAELAAQGTLVIGVFPGPVDTTMAEGVPLDKIAPIEVARVTLKAIECGIEDVYPDPISQNVFARLHEPLKAVEKQFAGMLPQ